MPERSPNDDYRRPLPTVKMRNPHAGPRYAELHCYSNFSFLHAASHPDELVETAAELGYHALAITDRHSLAGIVRAHVAAKEAGLKLLIGAEVHPLDGPPLVLLATDRPSYGRLADLLSRGKLRAPKGECYLSVTDVVECAEGLLACVLLPEMVDDQPFLTPHPQPPSPKGRGETGNSPPLTPDPSPPERGRGETRASHLLSPTPLSPSRGKGPISPLAPLRSEGLSVSPRPRNGGEGLGVRGAAKPFAFGVRGELAERVKGSFTPTTPLDAVYMYREAFRGRCYALAELHLGPNDAARLEQMKQLARRLQLPLAAAGGVLYHHSRRQFLHNVLTAIREKCTVAELDHRRFPNAQRYLKSPEYMLELFSACPEAVARTVEIADRCHFSLDELRYEYPHELCPAGYTPLNYLRKLTWEGAKKRYPGGIPDKVLQILKHEMKLIEELHYEPYFLTVWDLVRFARSRGILCQGRGSAANSAVCFCLGITSVDPDRIDVLFERFVSKERDEAPDIDVDFEHERREEIIQYIYEKYGRDRAGMTAEVITYRIRSAIREVSKALGLSPDQVEALAKAQEHFFEDEKLSSRFTEAGLRPDSRVGRQLAYLVRELLGFPRHLSQHVGGMVITQGPLRQLVPIENAAMPDRTVVEWDKDDLDALGILKVDCLALGMLTAIRKCFDLIDRHYGQRWTLATVPAEDPNVYRMIQKADTIGVFQIESRAQMSMLPRLQPNCFYDLVIEVAIVRPGPIQGDMVHPYLRRRSGAEPVTYPDERIREVLHKTLGVPLFQEQAMRLAVVAAGFTPGEADQLRRAMGAWRKRGAIEKFRIKLVDGMRANGYTAEFAEQVFHQISGFGEYGFPESHAASFALLVYVSAWIKCYYPAVFAVGILNSQPMGFYQPAQLVADAKQHGVEARPVDVNHSEWDCGLEEVEDNMNAPLTLNSSPPFGGRRAQGKGHNPSLAIRLGFRMVQGLSRVHADLIIKRRAEGSYSSFADFVRRTGLSSAVLTRLANADAFGSLGLDRRAALWRALDDQESMPLFDGIDANEPNVTLPKMPQHQNVLYDYQSVGLSLKGHPMQFLRPALKDMNIVPASALATLPNDCWLKVGGMVLLRQRPSTANGITFVTLEDETGLANLIIRPQVWDKYHAVCRNAAAMVAHGRLQREGQVIHVLTYRLEDLTAKFGEKVVRSRDFR